MTTVTPAGMTKKRVAAAKRDLVLVAGARLVALLDSGDGNDVTTIREARDEAISALVQWVAAERAAGSLP